MKPVEQFHLMIYGVFCRKGIANLYKRFRAIEHDDRLPIYGKTLKKLLLQNQESFGTESWYI